MRPAQCHPDRPHQARGLCTACYYREWILASHPERVPKRPRTYNVMDARRLLTAPPPRIADVRQEAFTSPPKACPKCGNRIALELAGREAHCRGHWGGCGWTGYLVRDEVVAYVPRHHVGSSTRAALAARRS